MLSQVRLGSVTLRKGSNEAGTEGSMLPSLPSFGGFFGGGGSARDGQPASRMERVLQNFFRDEPPAGSSRRPSDVRAGDSPSAGHGQHRSADGSTPGNAQGEPGSMSRHEHGSDRDSAGSDLPTWVPVPVPPHRGRGEGRPRGLMEHLLGSNELRSLSGSTIAGAESVPLQAGEAAAAQRFSKGRQFMAGGGG